MKYLLATFLFGFSALAHSVPLTDKILSSTAPRDSFAKCVVSAANQQLLSDIESLKILSAAVQDEAQSKVAALDFVTTRQSTRTVYTLLLTSLDENGWYLIQGSNGEIYASSSLVEDTAQFTTLNGQTVGSVQLSGCK